MRITYLQGGEVSDNPWVRPSPADVPAPARAETLHAAPAATAGVTAPQYGVPVPDRADRLPQRVVQQGATVWWLGVTGGAGESTLAAIARGSSAAEHAWPMPPGRGMQSRVVLVARTNYAGLTAAQRAATEWASGAFGDAIRVDGLVLIPDVPGRLPKELRELAQLVAGGVPQTWTLPWLEALRFGPLRREEALPKDFASLLVDLNLSSTAT